MSHIHFASLWSEIEHRKDLDNILYEQLGKSRIVDPKPRIEFLVVTKFVLDYQRRAIRTTSELSSMIPSVSTQVLEQLCSRILDLAQDRYQYQLVDLCRQTFVSALRVLFLLKDSPRWTCSDATLKSISGCIRKWSPRQPADIDVRFVKPLITIVESKLRGIRNDGNTLFEHCSAHRSGSQSRQPTWPLVEAHLCSHIHELTNCIKAKCPFGMQSLWELLDVNLMILIDSLESMPCPISTLHSICHHPGHQVRSLRSGTTLSSRHTWQVVQQCFSDATSVGLEQWRNWIMSLQDMPICDGPPCAGSCFTAPATQISFPESFNAICRAGQSLYDRTILQLGSSKLCSIILGKSQDTATEWMNQSAGRNAMLAFERTIDTASLALQPRSPYSSDVYIMGCGESHPITFQYLELLIQRQDMSAPDGLQDLRNGADTFKIKHDCPFCFVGVSRTTPEISVRRVGPLGVMMEQMQQLLLVTESETLRTPLLQSPVLTDMTLSPVIPSKNRSASNSTSFEYPESPTAVLRSGSDSRSRSPTTSDGLSSSSVASRLRGLFGNTTSITNPRETYHTVLSNDGGSVVAWTSSMACCFHTAIEQWSPLVVVSNTVLAAAGATYFALVCRTDKGDAITLYDLSSAELIGSAIVLTELRRKILNMKISQDGQLAVSTDREIILVRVPRKLGKDDWAKYTCHMSPPQPSAATSEEIKVAQTHFQVLSFSPDSERISIATRYSTGKVISCVFPTYTKSSGKFPVVADSSTVIPVGSADDRGLSDIACSRYGLNTEILLCASTNRTPPPKVQGWSTGSSDSRRSPYTHDISSSYSLTANRIQAGASVPGNYSGYVVLSEDSKLYVIKGDGYARRMDRIATDVDIPPPNSDSNYRRTQIAVTPNEVILFWLRNSEGHVARCDIHGQRSSVKTSVKFSNLFNG